MSKLVGQSESSAENFIAVKAYLRKVEKSQINILSSHPKNLGKEKQNKPKQLIVRREIIKIRAQINGTKNKNNNVKETKIWFSNKIKNINKPVARLI